MRRNAHAKLTKQINLGTLLRQIRSKGPISRAELVKNTHLSPTTVSVLVDELLKEGLVAEIGIGESSGGRRPILLEFQPTARLAIGVDIGVHKTKLALLDLDGNALITDSYVPDLSDKEKFLADLVHHLALLLETSKNFAERILGIGIATPGLLDRDKNNIVYSSSLGFADVPLYKTLTERFAYPIRINNDMNAAALGEKIMGAGRNISNLIYISIETGIGAGIIIDNRIYDGATGNAGEFGHTTVEPGGTLCKCGNRGCLGVMAAEPAMLSKAIQMLSSGAKTKISSFLEGPPSQITLEAIVSAAQAGDSVALSIINDSLDYLAIGIANLINMFAPAAIILGGSSMETMGQFALDRIREIVRERVLPSHGKQTYTIIPGQLKEQVGIVGASTLIFAEFLEFYHVVSAGE